ncbi:hypothetical protein BCR44DRAFT_1049902 [Catenaria anguillulae PL171]|uniref:Uncharacterized protein n=1 Tax=Catenaria anguillulae PL171 TaxID=765915 RepID=A0A1Y2HSS4_9FUNG|nr:hypothetical protein BCR44DRAFT_1049902 [Catenaria anguillulae PL171]
MIVMDYNIMPVNATVSNRTTAHVLLPSELLLSTSGLAHPSHHLLATCRFLATAFWISDPTLKRAWRHIIIFHAPLHQGSDDADDFKLKLNQSYSNAPHIQSRLTSFLKSRLQYHVGHRNDHDQKWSPACAIGTITYADDLAPDLPMHDLYINQELVDWLYSRPFARQQQLMHISSPIFFIRSRHPALLHHSLDHLHKTIPSLSATTAPVAHWEAAHKTTREVLGGGLW